MSDFSPLQQVEVFHLAFLRVLEVRLERARWVVKGGVNLRAWFSSSRYSEDLDVDCVSGSRASLEKRVDGVLASPALTKMLAVHGLAITRCSKPKQTDTTQRWKVEVTPADRLPLHTKIEFSRRGSDDPFELEPVRAEVVRAYGIPAPTVNHYTCSAAARQKIVALANRQTPQARDVWDLEHLFRTTGARPGELSSGLADSLPAALETVFELSFDVYQSQVIPFLAPDDQELFGNEIAWDRIRELVLTRLAELEGS